MSQVTLPLVMPGWDLSRSCFHLGNPWRLSLTGLSYSMVFSSGLIHGTVVWWDAESWCAHVYPTSASISSVYVTLPITGHMDEPSTNVAEMYKRIWITKGMFYWSHCSNNPLQYQNVSCFFLYSHSSIQANNLFTHAYLLYLFNSVEDT